MSSIDSISGSSSELSRLQQLLARQRGTTGSVTALGAGAANDSRRADFEAKFNEAAVAAGLDTEEVAGVQDEIQAAIAAATKKSDGTTDQREVIRGAIDGVLQKHGVDLEKFRSAMQSSMGGAGGPPPGGPPPGVARGAEFEAQFTDAAVAAGLDAGKADELQNQIKSLVQETLQNSAGTTDPRQAVQSAIDGLLEEYGVDLDQFKSQLQSSMSGLQGAIPLIDEQA
jgi:hypothetical protein